MAKKRNLLPAAPSLELPPEQRPGPDICLCLGLAWICYHKMGLCMVNMISASRQVTRSLGSLCFQETASLIENIFLASALLLSS